MAQNTPSKPEAKPEARPAKPARPEYKMPPVGLGETVLYFESRQDVGKMDAALAAIVSKVGSDSVCLNIIHPLSATMVAKDGVRHADHTDKVDENSEGYWVHRPGASENEARLSALEVLIEPQQPARV